MTHHAVDLARVRDASERIADRAHRTPIARCTALDRLAGRRLFFKCEHLQKAGAFKFRGACNAVRSLPVDRAARGVVSHSSGNHAQALALAAQLEGIESHIVIPSNAPAVKRRAVEGYGARIVACAPSQKARESAASRLLEETGGAFIHPYDDPDVIAGQGTAALELLQDVPDLDAIVAPVGGGGLMAGTCITAASLRPSLRLYAAEPSGADDAARSLAAGKLIPQTAPDTIADGLLTSLGSLTWPILRDHLEGVVTVDESAIVASMRLLWERAKLLVEPSAAVALAAVLSDEFKSLDGVARVGVILSGGNVELDHLPW